ncbi:MAG: hypothetical protein MHMPM18_000514 [Marteilia pararefringens]
MSSMAPQNNSPASTNRLQFPTIGEINDAAATADSLNNQILLSEMEFDDFQFFSEEEGEEDQLGDKVTDNDDNNSRMEKRRSDGIVRNKFSGLRDSAQIEDETDIWSFWGDQGSKSTDFSDRLRAALRSNNPQ